MGFSTKQDTPDLYQLRLDYFHRTSEPLVSQMQAAYEHARRYREIVKDPHQPETTLELMGKL